MKLSQQKLFPVTTSTAILCVVLLLFLTGPSKANEFQDIERLGEKRSWQNLQGSWGKRDYAPDDYDTNQISSVDDPEYDEVNALKYAFLFRNQQDQLINSNEQKRAWKAMNGAWGKRVGGNSADWNKFRGSWGKREPAWNNLKGLWGKRSANWNKLQSAWGKRDLSNTQSSF